ncbi:MAG: S8 family serine peptidase [Ekhidna sp.]
MNKVIVFLTLLVLCLSASSQEVNRYFAYFTDKEGADYPYNISSPEEFLTLKAIERRNKQGISINESDLPVNPAYTQSLKEAGAEVYFSSKWMNGALIQMDADLFTSIQGLSFIDSLTIIAEDKRLVSPSASPSIPTSFTDPSSMNGNSDIQLLMLGADHMHSDNVKGQGMLIAVLDNGYRGVNEYSPFKHLWENDRIVATKDFVQNSGNVFQFGDHGTSVLSIMGAKYETETDSLYGIAYESNYILCITEEGGSEDRIEEYNWLLGAEYADSLGADVINSSLGYKTFDIEEHDYTIKDLNGKTAISSLAATMAANKGIVVVVSAGNSGDSNNSERRLINHPSDADQILTVGSVRVDFSRSGFSSIGSTIDGRIKPDVAAFGDATAVVRGNGSISRGSGTSFASPLIAGFAACIWQANPDRNYNEIITAIKNSGHQASEPDNLLGWGVPNYSQAKDVKVLNVTDILANKITFYPNPFTGDKLYLHAEGKIKRGISVKILDAQGQEVFYKEYSAKDTKKDIELTIENSQPGVYYLFLQSGKETKAIKLINF